MQSKQAVDCLPVAVGLLHRTQLSAAETRAVCGIPTDTSNGAVRQLSSE